MLTETQAGRGISLSGFSPKTHMATQEKPAEARSATQGRFAAILEETDSAVAAGTPHNQPHVGEEDPETAASEKGGAGDRETNAADAPTGAGGAEREPRSAGSKASGDRTGTASPRSAGGPDGATAPETGSARLASANQPASPAQDEPDAAARSEAPLPAGASNGQSADALRSVSLRKVGPDLAAIPVSVGASTASPSVAGTPANETRMTVASADSPGGVKGAAETPAPSVSKNISGTFPTAYHDDRGGVVSPAHAADRTARNAAAPSSAPAPATSTDDALPMARPSAVPASARLDTPGGPPVPVASLGSSPGHAPSGQSALSLPAFDQDEVVRSSHDAGHRGNAHARAAAGTGPSLLHTPMAPLSSAIHAGHTPFVGSSGLSNSGVLQRSEHAQAADPGLTALEARLSGQTTQVTSQTAHPVPQRPDLPQQIVVQIAAAAEKEAAGTQRTIDLKLNPEELGRVRLRLSPSESGLTVMVVAERGETLDLLRRNIDMLAREFLAIGYEAASFDFAEGEPDQGDDRDAPFAAPLDDAPGAAPERRLRAPDNLTLRDRLDIRL